MADGKKSFILYSDQREIFDELTDEQAGKLIKHIYSYVNDENPVAENEFVKISFISIKLQLKRDLKKWKELQAQRVEAGKKSAEKRKRALTELNERSISSTVNDTVTVNVNDTVTTIKAVEDLDEKEFIDNGGIPDWRKREKGEAKRQALEARKKPIAEASEGTKEFENGIFKALDGKKISSEQLFKKHNILEENKEFLWCDFISNAIINTPTINDDTHAWNCFKKFVEKSEGKYSKKINSQKSSIENNVW